MRRFLKIVSSVAVAVLAGPSVAEPPRYRVQVIGLPDPNPLMATFASVGSVNDVGGVAGAFALPTQRSHGFSWQDGAFTTLGLPAGYTWSRPSAINNAGLVVGALHNDGLADEAAVAWSGGVPTLLPMPDWATISRASDVNDAGTIAGWAGRRAVLWSGGVPTALASPAGSTSELALGISTSGLVAGIGGLGSYGRAILWQDGQPTVLPVPAGTEGSLAYDVNDAGDAVGYTTTAPSTRAVLWRGGQMIDLGDFGVEGIGPRAIDLNEASQIVGGVERGGIGQFVGFLWEDGVMHDLNDLLEPGSGAFIVSASAISDTGLIAAAASFGGQYHSVLLIPVPAPGVVGAALAAMLCVSPRRRR